MVKVSLTNHNKESPYTNLLIDLMSGECILSEHEKIPITELLTRPDLSHPLFSETVMPHQTFFHYEYQDIEGLLYCGKFVYATLLKSSHPKECRFKINPSPSFIGTPIKSRIFFSPKFKKYAEKTISMAQFESFVTEIGDNPFKFSEDCLIDDEFTIKDLPQTLNGIYCMKQMRFY